MNATSHLSFSARLSLASTFCLFVGSGPPIASANPTGFPFSETFTLSQTPVLIQAEADSAAVTVQIGSRSVTIEANDAVAIDIGVVQLTPIQAVLQVRVEAEQEVTTLITPNGRVLWSGVTSFTGDPGERVRSDVETHDRTGDSLPDLVVGERRETTRICGSELALLNPRAVDPRRLTLRPVVIRPNAVNRAEAFLTASVQSRRVPVGGTLFSGAASSGSPGAPELTDDDPTTAWVEGRGGPGRWEFVTVGLGSGARPIHAVQFTFPQSPWVPPTEVFLVGSTTDDDVRVFRVSLGTSPPGTELVVELPDPAPWTCLSVVLDRAADESTTAGVGLAELSVLSDLDYGEGLNMLVRAVVQDRGEDGDRAVHLLSRMGDRGVSVVEDAWETLSPSGRQRALRIAEANPMLAGSARLLLKGLTDRNQAVRDKSLRVALELGVQAWEPLVSVLHSNVIDHADLEFSEGQSTSSVAEILASIDPERAIEPILIALASEQGGDRPTVRRGLRQAVTRSQAPIDAYDAWIDHAPVSALASAALALVGTDHPLRDRFLVRAVQGVVSFDDRYRAAEAAEGSDNAEVHDWLRVQLFDAEEWMVRERAVVSLSPQLDWLRVALADPYPRVRRSALAKFAELDRPRAVQMAARDPWALVRTIAPGLSTTEDGGLLTRLVSDRSFRVRTAAIEALTRHEDLSAITQVATRLNDRNEFPQVTVVAVEYASNLCLQELGKPLAEVVARGLLPNAWDPDIQTAVPALVALARIDPVEAEPVLARAQSPVSPARIRQAARQASSVEQCTR